MLCPQRRHQHCLSDDGPRLDRSDRDPWSCFPRRVPARDCWTDLLRRLAAFARVVTFDKRGQGLSDRMPGVPLLEERMDDVSAIMEAIGSKRTVLVGISEGAPMSGLFAASYPERVSHLVLWSGFARFTNTSDFSLMSQRKSVSYRRRVHCGSRTSISARNRVSGASGKLSRACRPDRARHEVRSRCRRRRWPRQGPGTVRNRHDPLGYS